MEGLGVAILLIWWITRKPGGSHVRFIQAALVCVGARGSATAALFLLPTITPSYLEVFWLVSLVPAALIWFPTLVLERIIVPLRMPRAAYWVARIFHPLSFTSDSAAGAVVYGALALARKEASAQNIDWLKRRFDRTWKPEPQGGGLLAAGLLAALRGDRQQARCLLRIADAMPARRISRKARCITRDWLVADAARVGRWREVIRIGKRGKQSLRWSYALARIAERLVGDARSASNLLLCVLWLLSPRRRTTLPLLRRALTVPRVVREPMRSGAKDLSDAFSDLAHVVKNSEISGGESLASSVAAIEAALDTSSTRSHIEQRLSALGARHDVVGILTDMHERLVDLLTELLEISPHLASARTQVPAVEEAIAKLRTRIFRDIKGRCQDYEERKQNSNALDAPAEWGTWALLRDAAERLLRLDPSCETTLFEAMWRTCNNFAVFQHNYCKRRMLAFDMYSWLHQYAQSDEHALKLLSKNMKAALG